MLNFHRFEIGLISFEEGIPVDPISPEISEIFQMVIIMVTSIHHIREDLKDRVLKLIPSMTLMSLNQSKRSQTNHVHKMHILLKNHRPCQQRKRDPCEILDPMSVHTSHMEGVIESVVFLMNPVQFRMVNQSMDPIEKEILHHKTKPGINPEFPETRQTFNIESHLPEFEDEVDIEGHQHEIIGEVG